jgi:glutamine amidotransferase
MIAVIDYGMGNIHSVNKALQKFGAKTIITNKPEDIGLCDKAVLPGVGAFDDAMEELKKQKLIPAINSLVKAKKPFLGICLGMQLLFETSEEAKSRKGLGLLKGKVIRFKQRGELKVPHMGWNQIKIKNKTKLLSGIEENSFVYFCHSYYPVPMDKEIVAATCDYGASFACAVSKNSIYGVQFHPEKSQSLGLRMLENFVNLC